MFSQLLGLLTRSDGHEGCFTSLSCKVSAWLFELVGTGDTIATTRHAEVKTQSSTGSKGMRGVGLNVVKKQNAIFTTPPIMLEEILPYAPDTWHGQDPLKQDRTMSKINLQTTLHAFTGCGESVACSPSPLLDSLEFGFTTELTTVAPLSPSTRFNEDGDTHKSR